MNLLKDRNMYMMVLTVYRQDFIRTKPILLWEYYEKATYDLNGNIKTIKRTAQRMGATALLIDNLTYDYENSNMSNRIKYNVNGNIYVESDGFLESQKVNVGDIIKVKYSIDKPELMITEFNEYF
ncbi:hypothetical protein [Chryseobacterium salviniae]|uniref:Uncharacterized protein n=1 Tax=Chryseobacterium salviniae TaxID=3101750 RepID=A0ABU6HTT3_9FLAO|nr:hypothetical protein [Chryseobacterium sp. T9W2-O]MEC3875332.1 hypothetical protein [Chryseobacterium sp. T9W2-O]